MNVLSIFSPSCLISRAFLRFMRFNKDYWNEMNWIRELEAACSPLRLSGAGAVLTDWLTDWQTDWLTDRRFNWLTCMLIGYTGVVNGQTAAQCKLAASYIQVVNWLTDRDSDTHVVTVTYGLWTDWLTDVLIRCTGFVNGLTLSHCTLSAKIGWDSYIQVVNWLTDWPGQLHTGCDSRIWVVNALTD